MLLPPSNIPIISSPFGQTTPLPRAYSSPAGSSPEQQHITHLPRVLSSLQPIQQSVLPKKSSSPSIRPPTSWYYPTINHIYDINGKCQTIDTLCASLAKPIWEKALSNEWGRLAQSNIHGVIPPKTVEFIPAAKVPLNNKVTYASFVCDHRPLKTEPWWVRIVAGGDKLTYDADTGSTAASLLETKILITSTISDASKGARFMSLDLKDFFLATPMIHPEYMTVPFKFLPNNKCTKYNLHDIVHDNYIYTKINKGVYGLKQAAVLAYKNLINKLAPYGYEPIQHIDSYWQHKTNSTKFCLCVNDFGVKYFTKRDIQHLISVLQQSYKISTDFDKLLINFNTPHQLRNILLTNVHVQLLEQKFYMQQTRTWPNKPLPKKHKKYSQLPAHFYTTVEQ